MKRSLLISLFALSLLACHKEVIEPSLVGTWRFDKMIYGAALDSYPTSALVWLDTLKGDGTFSFYSDGTGSYQCDTIRSIITDTLFMYRQNFGSRVGYNRDIEFQFRHFYSGGYFYFRSNDDADFYFCYDPPYGMVGGMFQYFVLPVQRVK